MQKRIVATVLLLLIGTLMISGYVSSPALQPVKVVNTDRFDNGLVRTKNVTFQNGDTYQIKRFEFSQDREQPYILTLPLDGNNGTFRYAERLGGNAVWQINALEGELPQKSGFIHTDRTHMLINASNLFIKNEAGTIEQQPNPLPMTVIRQNGAYLIQVQFPQRMNYIAEVWTLKSQHPLVDWGQAPAVEQTWLSLDLQDQYKWSWDGYYARTPDSYTPSSPSMFWRLPTNYAAYRFVNSGAGRAGDDLGWVMLDTILPNQNSEGYWQTQPRSDWLWTDYQIGADFFDTRFNTDIATLLLQGSQKYGDGNFFASASNYADYLCKHIEYNHYTNYGEGEGWLVADYAWHEPHKMTHVSLNHQLQEMNFLYRMYIQTHQELYKSYADKLIFGIKNSKSMWIKPDQDLYYAFLGDGGMGMTDYPYLTYNDLVDAQTLLLKINGQLDPDLGELMASKKLWMDQTGVTGYQDAVF